MGCCNINEKSEYLNDIEKVKGGKSILMEKRIVLWIIIGALFLAVLFLTFKTGGAGASTGNVVQSAGIAAKSVASSSGGMVGGC